MSRRFVIRPENQTCGSDFFVRTRSRRHSSPKATNALRHVRAHSMAILLSRATARRSRAQASATFRPAIRLPTTAQRDRGRPNYNLRHGCRTAATLWPRRNPAKTDKPARYSGPRNSRDYPPQCSVFWRRGVRVSRISCIRARTWALTSGEHCFNASQTSGLSACLIVSNALTKNSTMGIPCKWSRPASRDRPLQFPMGHRSPTPVIYL